VSRDRITFTAPGETHHFCVGDRIGEHQIVLRVEHEANAVILGEATRWRRLRFWCRDRLKHLSWWLRCTWADLWTREDPDE